LVLVRNVEDVQTKARVEKKPKGIHAPTATCPGRQQIVGHHWGHPERPNRLRHCPARQAVKILKVFFSKGDKKKETLRNPGGNLKDLES